MDNDSWIRQARQHWREFQPTRYRELENAGLLEQALKDAAERTRLEMNQLEEQGFQSYEAWVMTRENYLFPAEEPIPDEEVNEMAALTVETYRVLNELRRDPDEETSS